MVERVNTVWLFLSSAFWGIVCAPILNAFTSDPIADVINSMIFSTGIIFLFSLHLWLAELQIQQEKSMSIFYLFSM